MAISVKSMGGKPKLDGTAATWNVIRGKTFYSTDSSIKMTGTMPDNGTFIRNVNPNDTVYIPKGYHDGNGKVVGKGTPDSVYNNMVAEKDRKYNDMVSQKDREIGNLNSRLSSAQSTISEKDRKIAELQNQVEKYRKPVYVSMYMTKYGYSAWNNNLSITMDGTTFKSAQVTATNQIDGQPVTTITPEGRATGYFRQDLHDKPCSITFMFIPN